MEAAVQYLVGRLDVDVSDFAYEEGEDGRTGEKSALHIAAIHDSPKIAEILVKDATFKMDRVDSRVSEFSCCFLKKFDVCVSE